MFSPYTLGEAGSATPISQRRKTEVRGDWDCFCLERFILSLCRCPELLPKLRVLFHVVPRRLLIPAAHPASSMQPSLDPGSLSPWEDRSRGASSAQGRGCSRRSSQCRSRLVASAQAQRSGLRFLLTHVCMLHNLSAGGLGLTAWSHLGPCQGWLWSQLQDSIRGPDGVVIHLLLSLPLAHPGVLEVCRNKTQGQWVWGGWYLFWKGSASPHSPAHNHLGLTGTAFLGC